MSIVLAAVLAASTASLPSCSWDRPGVNPFMGNVVAAVDRYADIPAPTRAALKARMAKRQYDDIATITRDGIAGQQRYTDLRDMHFGGGRVCQTVTRERWTPSTQERGLVYCEDGHCIIVPTVCRNVSRVTREPQARAANEGTGADGSATESPQMLAAVNRASPRCARCRRGRPWPSAPSTRAARAAHHPFDHRAVAGDVAVGQEGLQRFLGAWPSRCAPSMRSLPLTSVTPGGRWISNTVPRAVLRSSARLLT
jgi:hypothetical protein